MRAVFELRVLALSRGTPCAVLLRGSPRRRQAPREAHRRRQDRRARFDKNYVKIITSFANTILVKDNVKDTMWITCLLGQSNRERAVIGAVYVAMDFGFFDSFYKLICNKKIVYSPADVSVACAGLHIPVSVRIFGVRIEMAE